MLVVMTDHDYESTALEEELASVQGVDFSYRPARSAGQIAQAALGAQVLLTSYGSYDTEVIGALPDSVRAICKSGTGYDNIDVAAATRRGVAVCNVTGYGTEVVSDHAIALAMDCLRQVTACDRALRVGTWSYQKARPMGQVAGRTFGVVGFGAIGQAVASKAAGLGFAVAVSSRSLVPGTKAGRGWPVLALDELLSSADVVSFHVALTEETRHLLDERRIALLGSGAVVVNTSRGAVVDTEALARALGEGRIWGAGLDVYEEEPLPRDHPILAAPRTVLTPHSAYFSEESIVELRRRCFMNGVRVARGEDGADVVNPEVLAG